MANESSQAKAWYLQRSKPELANVLCGVVDRLVMDDQERLLNYEKWVMMYGGRKKWPSALRPGQGPRGLPGPLTTAQVPNDSAARLLASSDAPLRLNVVKAAIDTVTAKVGRMRPRPTFLTDGGDWGLQRKAKLLQRFMDGAFHQSDAYELALDWFRDAMVLGTGVLVPYARGYHDTGTPRICLERAPAWEFFVDQYDAEGGSPRCLYRVRWVSRERVRLYWGDDVAEGRSEAGDPEYVRLVEAWFRPVDPSDQPEMDAKVSAALVVDQGRHVLMVDDKVIEDGYFPYTDFPPRFFHWNRPVAGFWGDSATREVEGVQIEINRLLHDIQRCMRLVGTPVMLEQSGANCTPHEKTNEIMARWVYDGQVPPTITTFQPINPQVVGHLWSLYEKAFEILGSNQLAASATAPAGMESGRAVERLSEEHSERFLTVSRAFELALGADLARQFIRLAKELDATLKGGFKLRAPGGNVGVSRSQTVRIAWKDVAIDSDGYILQVFATSALPTQPGARIEEIERLQGMGVIDADTAARLLDFPDLAQHNSYAAADYEALLWQLERMLEHGEDVLPEPYQNLQRAVKLGQSAILRAQMDGAPATHVALVRAFVAAAVDMLEGAMQQPAAAAPEGAAPDTMIPDAATGGEGMSGPAGAGPLGA